MSGEGGRWTKGPDISLTVDGVRSRVDPLLAIFFFLAFFIESDFLKKSEKSQAINLASQEIFLAFFFQLDKKTKKQKTIAEKKKEFSSVTPRVSCYTLSYCFLSFAIGKSKTKSPPRENNISQEKNWLARKNYWPFFSPN